MSQIILDISPNTHKNDNITIHRMINAIRSIDTRKHEIIFKTQIFRSALPNIPITEEALNFFGFCAKLAGYKWTASIFDLESLDMLMKYEEDLPFIKIACRPDLYWLAGEIKREIPVYLSYNKHVENIIYGKDVHYLACIPKYPALFTDYNKFEKWQWNEFSDHTIGFELWNYYKPEVIEWHYKEKDSTGPDAGPFAKTVEDLRGIL